MRTSVEFVNHASVIIKGDKIALLSDPWYQGHAFHKGWNLLVETSDEDAEKILNKITHIWISHEHPDHFSVLFLKKFAAKIKENSIKILFQETKDKRVLNFLNSLSLECIELAFNKSKMLDDQFSVTCIKDGFYDSGLLVTNGNEKILNLNDCEVTTDARAKEVLAITGEVDLLLTQFSFAAWKGGEENKKWRDEAAREKLKTMALQIKYFKPDIVIPFASFVYFSNTENFYLNDAINKPEDVLNEFESSSAKIILMKPNDIVGGDLEDISNERALEFWQQQYSDLESRPLNTYEKIDENVILENFSKYCDRIAKSNNMRFIKFIRSVSPIAAFKPVIVKITDLDITLKFDYVTKTIKRTDEPPMLCMSSESINFLFSNSFGFDTLTVNGCFEEGENGGFVKSTKTLAIENLNNLGIYVTPSTLFNVNIIKLFLTRLYRVARKLEA